MSDLTERLEHCRRLEKEQALFYRALAADAEVRGDPELAQRFHDLHADEQHHLSRLTARLIELGHQPAELPGAGSRVDSSAPWEALARRREHDEIARYEALLREDLDRETRVLIEEMVEVERHHATELGGKWTMA